MTELWSPVSRVGSRRPSSCHGSKGRQEPTLLQLSNQNAAELDGVTVVLQRDSAASWDAGERHVVDHQFAVEQHGRSVALHRDVEAVPLADRFVEALLGSTPGADFGGQRLIDSVATNLAAANRAAPHVDLRLVVAKRTASLPQLRRGVGSVPVDMFDAGILGVMRFAAEHLEGGDHSA